MFTALRLCAVPYMVLTYTYVSSCIHASYNIMVLTYTYVSSCIHASYNIMAGYFQMGGIFAYMYFAQNVKSGENLLVENFPSMVIDHRVLTL